DMHAGGAATASGTSPDPTTSPSGSVGDGSCVDALATAGSVFRLVCKSITLRPAATGGTTGPLPCPASTPSSSATCASASVKLQPCTNISSAIPFLKLPHWLQMPPPVSLK